MSFYNVAINKLKQSNSFEKILYLNIAVYVFVSIFRVILFLIQVRDSGVYYPVNYLSLPADLDALLYHPWSVITYMFLHEDFLHILFNMLWFFWFGKLFVAYIGAKKLTALYIIGGLFGAIFYIAAFNLFPVFAPIISKSYALGASASVIAVVVAVSFYIPDHKVNLMFIGDVKLKYIALFSIVVDFLSIAGENSGGHIAHLGGAFFGFLYAMQFKRGKDLLSWFSNLFSGISFSLKRKPKMKATYSKAKEMDDKEYNYEKARKQKEIDAVLDKISKSGYESLSKKEKEILFNSSKPN
ncbi:MAG: rhomboid family intramembrane serine protease [Bacteroidia bacterium]|nr:rhomboid family intramembrane serine protease [Bacteroidia bacterium]